MQFDFSQAQKKITRKILAIFQIQTEQLSKSIRNSTEKITNTNHNSNFKPTLYRRQRQKVLEINDLTTENPFTRVNVSSRHQLVQDQSLHIISTRNPSQYNTGRVDQEAYDRSYTFDWKGTEIINSLILNRKAEAFRRMKTLYSLPSSLSFRNSKDFANPSKLRQVQSIQIQSRKGGSVQINKDSKQSWIEQFLRQSKQLKMASNSIIKQKDKNKLDLTNKLIPILEPQLFNQYTQASLR